MTLIPGLPYAVAILLFGLAVATPLLLPDSRQRVAFWQAALVASLWSAISGLYWQQVPLLGGVWLGLTLLLGWMQWRLFAAVCQVELRRRSVLWLGRVLLAGFLIALVLDPAPLVAVEAGHLLWQDGWLLRALALAILLVLLLSLVEWTLGVVVMQERGMLAPWVGVWILLSWGLLLDLVAAMPEVAGSVPPAGSGLVALAMVLALLLNLRRSGPFPLHGEIPRGAFAQTADAVVLVDGAQRVQAVSPAALDLLGVTRGQLIGRRLQSLLPGAPLLGTAWETPLWLAQPERPDGGLWLHAADWHAADSSTIARVLHLRGGNVWPGTVEAARAGARSPQRWLQGGVVRPTLESVLRRYGIGRQGRAASLHVDYDWERVQQEQGDALLDGLLEAIGERLARVCDWTVECLRLPNGQFVLLLTDLTSSEELNTLVHRAQGILATPFALAGKQWALKMRLAVVPDLRLYRTVDDWLLDAAVALQESRGQVVSSAPHGEQRGRLTLALEQSLLHDGIQWQWQPILNLTTQQVVAWRAEPFWHPEPEIRWQGQTLRAAVAHLHMQRAFYAQAAKLQGPREQAVWLEVPITDLAEARKGLGEPRADLVLQLDRISAEALAEQGLRAAPDQRVYAVPASAGRGFGFGLQPGIIALDRDLILPGIVDDVARQALIRGCRGAARVRDQRVYAAGISLRADLQMLRELGVDYASGPAVGPALAATDAARFVYKPYRD